MSLVVSVFLVGAVFLQSFADVDLCSEGEVGLVTM